MYGPGGAAARLDGRVIETAAVAGEKLRGTRRWPWSKAWVTELKRINVTFVMAAASGVPATLGVMEAAAGGAAGDEHVASRQQGGVHLAARERHRAGVLPRGIRLIEIDDLRRTGRRVAAAGVENLARLVHHGGSVVSGSELAQRAIGPLARAPDVEVAGLLRPAGVKDAAGGGYQPAGGQRQGEGCPRHLG